jgi:hypothetical protein
MSLSLARAAADISPASASAVAAYISAAFAIALGVGGIINARWVAKRTGENSDKALARTLEADREGRVVEHRLRLYAEMLTFLAQRRQSRKSKLAEIKINGVQHLEQYEPTDVFRLGGNAEAHASDKVLAAFVIANDADQEVIQTQNINANLAAAGEPAPKTWADIQNLGAICNEADEAVKAAIRGELKRQVIN